MDNIRKPILGTWSLISATATDANQQPLPLPYGPIPIGRIVFDHNNRMLCMVCDGRPEIPAGEARAYTSYGGRFTFDGKRLVTRLDVAADPTRIGSDQVRDVFFRDDCLVIVNTRAQGVQRELTWTKLEATGPR